MSRAARVPWRVLAPAGPAVLLALVGLVGPWIAPGDPARPVTGPFAPAGAGGALGGDVLGRDVLSRLLHGGRGLVGLGLLIAGTATALGGLLGMVAALRPGVGRVVDRAVDVLMLVPSILVVLLVALSWPGGGSWAVALAAIAMSVPYAARVMAAAAAPVSRSGFVEAAVAGGERLWALTLRESLPNLRSTLLTLFGLRFVEAVYVVSAAAFLQVGPQPPAADWALMIRENAAGMTLNPWAVLAPSLAVVALSVGVNLAVDAAAAPTARRRSPVPVPAVVPARPSPSP